MIFATVIAPKIDFYILTPMTLNSKLNHRWMC